MNEFDPATEPGGDLQPPSRRPPTALATATPPPPAPMHRRPYAAQPSIGLFALKALQRMVVRALDFADDIAAAVTGPPGR